ncbi:RNA polymerase C-22 sterol desaturase [Mucor velutinosus]|uniref:RNA polymerase C-22 sterol desaturase n=2 Tax=Mucor TaxID=4830 RepID=A0AAN7DF87_9FUNG|nr:RNA polymerase C-22 sterol desaturase [Mucor velutinosus]
MSQNTHIAAPPTPQADIALPSTSTPTVVHPLSGSLEEYTFSNVPQGDMTNYDQTEHYEEPALLRAGLATKPRLVLMTSIGSFWGFSIGAYLGGRQSGLQYLAENAHKLPTTVQGWYFYHKTKNYRMMLGGVKRGVRFAGKTGGLCLLYGSLEAALDDMRGEADVMNSVAAGVTTGTVFSALTRLTRGSFRYSVVFGAIFGLAAGGLSDLHRFASGNPPSYGLYLASLVKGKKEIDSRVE